MTRGIVGIHLDSMRPCAAHLAFVHNSYSDWAISSDYPVDAVLSCPLSSTRLPGRLGAYIYPADAVIHINGTNTSLRQVRQLVHREANDAQQIANQRVAVAQYGYVHHELQDAAASSRQQPQTPPHAHDDDSASSDVESGGGVDDDHQCEYQQDNDDDDDDELPMLGWAHSE